MKNNGFVKVACVTPELEIGNPNFNVNEMLKQIDKAAENKAQFILFPELNVTSYTCQDLFFQNYLIDESKKAIKYLLDKNTFNGVIIIGAPIEIKSLLYNCAVVIYKNTILGIIPKKFLPNHSEFYEKRWFNVGTDIVNNITEVDYIYENIPFGNIIFKETSKEVSFGIEICEDMWAPISPGNVLALNGAEVIFNLSASNELLYKDFERKNTIVSHSTRNIGAYVYCSAGVYESTTDTVFSGHNVIAQLGSFIADEQIYKRGSYITYGDIDLNRIKFKRRQNSTLRESFNEMHYDYHFVKFDANFNDNNFIFTEPLDKTPFIPKKNIRDAFNKILNIQVTGLAKRIEHTNLKSLLIGISGGLDSTLALLVAVKTYEYLNLDKKNIIAVTMPGFGTSKRTKGNALALMNQLGVTLEEIDLTESVLEHFKAIGHDPKIIDTTYENAQARERTNILMNLANKHNGIVLGTGDLSELALGWCTYNGDHMSNYSINAGLPKTLVQFMVKCFADFIYQDDEIVSNTLLDILDTPISPELTGQDQSTEDLIGKYEVHDFIIYRMLVCGDSESRIKYLLTNVYTNVLTEADIDNYLNIFYRRFFTQQFKRSALPDGPKVIDISLSPRADWRMPSDAKYIR